MRNRGRNTCRRSCSEVLNRFEHLLSITDFTEEALHWQLEFDPMKSLVFVAYFVTQADLANCPRELAE